MEVTKRSPVRKKRVVSDADKPKLSKAERRKKFGKAISMDMYNSDRGHTPGWKPCVVGDGNEGWDMDNLIRCAQCNKIYGAVYLKPDNKWYCTYCEDNIAGHALKEHINKSL